MQFGIFTVSDITEDPTTGRTPSEAERIRATLTIARHAEDDEILVSQTVKDLVVGSDFRLSKKKSTILKELPGTWTLHAVYRPSASILSR